MKGKVVVVTGGGRGIGRATCRRFAREGAKVVAVGRTAEQLEHTRRLIEQDGGVCETVRADVAVNDDVEEMIENVVESFGGVDVLVNNAGVAPQAAIETLDEEVFDAMIGVNVRGVFYACRAVWPIMTKRGGGVIVNISSLAAVDPFPGFAAYGASKCFVEGLTKGLAAEGRKRGIRVYCIGPGAVETQMLRGPFPDFPADQCLQPEDVADAIWSMTQPANRYAVGQTVYVSKS